MSAKKNVAAVAAEIYNLLEGLDPEDRQRAIAGALALLGGSVGAVGAQISTTGLPGALAGTAATTGTAAAFFSEKQPENKIEELAVAARYREIHGATTHTKEQLHETFKEARRNFDGHNFRRDINNAKRKGLFTRGSANTLAYYGQQYVDALPNREAVKSLKSPNRGKRAAQKRASKK